MFPRPMPRLEPDPPPGNSAPRLPRGPSPVRAIRPRIALALLAALVCTAAPIHTAHGHGRSLSYSSWRMTDEGAQVRVRVSLLELSRLGIALPLRGPASPPSTSEPIGALLADHVRLLGPGGVCPPSAPPVLVADDDGWVQYRWSVRCDGSGARTIESDLLLDVAPSHLHFARLLQPEGAVVERVLVEGASRWPIASRAPGEEAAGDGGAASSIGDYIVLGIEHIVTGWDHLAFVFALILIARRGGEVVRLVTGFTVAHSLTLALAVLGLVQPVGHAVEAVIGFSVALVAAENAWLSSGRSRAIPIASLALLVAVGVAGIWAPAALPALTVAGLAVFTACHFALLGRAHDPAMWRVALAFAFGLVHGFGFAGVLADMSLPAERLAPALFGFNVGVELGQLAVVAVAWPLLRAVHRLARPSAARWVPDLASAGVCGIGLYWFVQRGLGLG